MLTLNYNKDIGWWPMILQDKQELYALELIKNHSTCIVVNFSNKFANKPTTNEINTKVKECYLDKTLKHREVKCQMLKIAELQSSDIEIEFGMLNTIADVFIIDKEIPIECGFTYPSKIVKYLTEFDEIWYCDYKNYDKQCFLKFFVKDRDKLLLRIEENRKEQLLKTKKMMESVDL